MEEKKSSAAERYFVVIETLLYSVLPAVVSFISLLLGKSGLEQAIKFSAFVFVLGGCFIVYYAVSQEDRRMGLVYFLPSVLWILLIMIIIASPLPGYLPLWMVPCIFASAFVSRFYGLLLGFFSVILPFACSSIGEFAVVWHMVLFAFLCLILNEIQTLSGLFFALAASLAVNFSLAILFQGFKLRAFTDSETIFCAIFCSVMLAVAGTVKLLYDRKQQEKSQTDERKNRKLWEATSPEFSLHCRVKKEAPTLYQHLRLTSELAMAAAACISADELLACAGGFYHEIGRLQEGDYITEGIRILNEYSLPKEIGQIILQQNISERVPTTKEAALVLLTDSILSAAAYFVKNGEVCPIEKIIDQTFRIRFEKGTLNLSGLSVQDLHQLKQFFQEQKSVIIQG